MIKSIEQKVLKKIIRGYEDKIDGLYLIDEVVTSYDLEKQDEDISFIFCDSNENLWAINGYKNWDGQIEFLDCSEFLNLQSVVKVAKVPKESFEYKKQDHPIGDI